MSEQRYFIHLSYDGSAYHGWQIQPNAVSVQQLLAEALAMQLADDDILLVGCGRTDTGVHALNYYAHFDVMGSMNDKELRDLETRLNKQLPSDISIKRVFPVPVDSHARFSAVSRTYKYYIQRVKDPFGQDYSYYYYGPLNVEMMNEGAGMLLTYDDFTSFSRLHTQVKDHICHVSLASWVEEEDKLIFTITADRFLRNMVRAVVGTLLDLGRGKIGLEAFRSIIESKDRGSAGPSAPAQGLFLYDVKYPEGIIPRYTDPSVEG